jgi:hypothetical protein
MVDPLSPTAGVWPRLTLALLLCVAVWLGVIWALS